MCSFGVDTENFNEGEGTGPYVFTFELEVMITAGGCCWLRSKFFVINLSKKIPFSFFNSSGSLLSEPTVVCNESSAPVFTML